MIRKPDFSQTRMDIESYVRSHADERGFLKMAKKEVDPVFALMYKSEYDTDISEYAVVGLRMVGDCLETCLCVFPVDEDTADSYMDSSPWTAIDNNPEIIYAQTLFNIANEIENYGKENA